jgi:RNA polymerase subunit RPABC4/transcription elongation factor Spt4
MNETQSPSKPAEDTCKYCGAVISKGSKFCPSCGKTAGGTCVRCGSALTGEGKFCASCGLDLSEDALANTSGQGSLAVVPPEIKKWNWGALLLHWIWGLGNKVYIMLLCLIPYVGLIMAIVGGAKGSEWAWRNKKWENIEHFKRVQKKWAWWGLGVWVAIFLLYIMIGIIMESY